LIRNHYGLKFTRASFAYKTVTLNIKILKHYYLQPPPFHRMRLLSLAVWLGVEKRKNCGGAFITKIDCQGWINCMVAGAPRAIMAGWNRPLMPILL
jgi:hypothetical protein